MSAPISAVFRYSVVADSGGHAARTEDVISVNIDSVSAIGRFVVGIAKRSGAELDSSSSLGSE